MLGLRTSYYRRTAFCHHFQVLVHCWSAQSANPGKFTLVQHTLFESRIVLKETSRYVVHSASWPTEGLTIVLGFDHSGLNVGTRYLRFQIRKNGSHRQECSGVGSCFSIPAIDLYAADDNELQFPVSDNVQYLSL